jgi:hypothetical protein
MGCWGILMPNEEVSVVEVNMIAPDDSPQGKFNDHVAAELRAMKSQLDANTAQTAKIYAIVLLFEGTGEFLTRWGNRFRNLVVWLTPIGVGLYWVWKWIDEYRRSKHGG